MFLTYKMPLDFQGSRVAKSLNTDRRILFNTCAIIVLANSIILLSTFTNPSQSIRTSSLLGMQCIAEVLSCNNSRRCQEVFRMKVEVFHFLCSELTGKDWLE